MELTPPTATILAALVGGLLLLRVQRRNAFRLASTKFRTAVTSALKEIYPLPANWPSDIDAYLRERFPSLQAAVAEFRPHVGLMKRRAFDRAWQRFRNAYGRPQDVQVYHHYVGFTDMPEPTKTFQANVDSLLSFADAT